MRGQVFAHPFFSNENLRLFKLDSLKQKDNLFGFVDVR